MSDIKETVKVHLLKIVILRNDTSDKTKKLVGVLYTVAADINQTDLVVQLVHMLCALVQIADIAENILNFRIDLIQ